MITATATEMQLYLCGAAQYKVVLSTDRER